MATAAPSARPLARAAASSSPGLPARNVPKAPAAARGLMITGNPTASAKAPGLLVVRDSLVHEVRCLEVRGEHIGFGGRDLREAFLDLLRDARVELTAPR